MRRMKREAKLMTRVELLVFAGICAAIVSFLQGMDAGFRHADEVAFADRQRVYCSTPGHIPSFCREITHGLK